MSKRNKKKLKQLKAPRNPFAFDPIMRKGGAHDKSTKAKRQKDKQSMKRELKTLPFDFSGTTFLRTMLTALWFNGIVSPSR